MSHGFVNPGGWGVGGIVWSETDLAGTPFRPRGSGSFELLTRRIVRPLNVPSLRCLACQLVVLDYSHA
jgi:hypothetical protein